MSAVVQVFKADSKPPRRRGHSRQHTGAVTKTLTWSLDLCKRIFLNSYEKKIEQNMGKIEDLRQASHLPYLLSSPVQVIIFRQSKCSINIAS